MRQIARLARRRPEGLKLGGWAVRSKSGIQVGRCRPHTRARMNSQDVAQIVRLLAGRGIEVWLDGGWAVDALVGYQTRNHDDLDMVVRGNDLPHLLGVLAKECFSRAEGG